MLEPFFGIHQDVIRSGLWAKMKPGEKDLYICLMHRSERYSSREVTITDDAVRKEVGAAPRTLRNARKKLQELGLIQCRKVAGNKYVYVICDPATGKPYPGDPKQPIRYKKREKQAPESRPQSPVIGETAAIVEARKPQPESQKATENELSDNPGMTEHGLRLDFGNYDGEEDDNVPF